MAGATEQEQQKTNQLLEKVEQRTTESTGKLDALIEAVKQPSEYEKVAEDIAKDTKDLHETAEKHDKEIKKVTKQLSDNIDKHVQQVGEDNKLNQVHNQFIKDQEKKKEGMMKAADARSKREAKLATRMGKGAWDWTKGKVSGVAKAAGSFFDNLMKLMALMGLWFALSWLKGKDLKKMWDDFRKQLDLIMDEWIPQWVKDLSFGEAMGVAIGTFVSAWLLVKGALLAAGKTLSWIGNSITSNVDSKSRLHKQIMNMRGKLTDLVNRRNAIKMAMKMTDDLDIKSKLGQELKKTNAKILELETKIKAKTTAMEQVKTMAKALADEGKLSKDLKKTNKLLAKAQGKVNVATRAAELAKNLSMDSKVGKDLLKANEEFAKYKNQQKMQTRQLRTTQYNIMRGKAGLSVLPEGYWVDEGGRVRTPGDMGGFAGKDAEGKPYQKMADLDPKTKVKTKPAGGGFFSKVGGVFSRAGTAISEGVGGSINWAGTQLQALGQTKYGAMALKGLSGLSKGAGWLALVQAIIEPIRGGIGAYLSARERGESVFDSLISGSGGALHGLLDIVPALVEFMELLAGAGINVGGFLAKALGMDEKTVDTFLQDFFDGYKKYTDFMGGGKGLSGGMKKLLEVGFGSWKQDTTLMGRHQALKGTEMERSFGDYFGAGVRSDKVGFLQSLAETYGDMFTGLRKEDDSLMAISDDIYDWRKTGKMTPKLEKWFAARDKGLKEHWFNKEVFQPLSKIEFQKELVEAMKIQNAAALEAAAAAKDGGFFIDNRSSSSHPQYIYAEKTTTSELKSK